MVALQMIPASPVELTQRRKRLSAEYRLIQALVAIKGIELQFERMRSGGKSNEKTFEIGQEIVLLKAKALEREDGIVHIDGMLSWLAHEESLSVQRLAS